MTGEQSRQLKVGDKVCWQNDQADQGTVTDKNWSGLIIKWNSRGEQNVLHNDMAAISRSKKMRGCAERIWAREMSPGLIFKPAFFADVEFPAEHSARLIALGYLADIAARLRMTTPGRAMMASGTVKLETA